VAFCSHAPSCSFEHLIIDTVSFVTEERTVSGVTGAHSGSTELFDLFVECPDPAVAALATHQALDWIAALVKGQGLGVGLRATLEMARHLYRVRGQAVEAGAVSSELGRPLEEIRETLERLEEVGFARRIRYGLNLSGAKYYALCTNESGDGSEAASVHLTKGTRPHPD